MEGGGGEGRREVKRRRGRGGRWKEMGRQIPIARLLRGNEDNLGSVAFLNELRIRQLHQFLKEDVPCNQKREKKGNVAEEEEKGGKEGGRERAREE